ncbi:glycosyltransferase [Exilibacterium tricleocarpae]|uniref:Glycosyltransferase n=1 Tax=Exilibacterium tricleocarpae TaxID=2591008 RepID=A0A545U3Y7_9GAMM|nr:TIGR04282 family arsenosugar biosynthesis glycosyltransferase [Exilibacterium tricleocarpae]TQV84123.1 glycosyltransferase [Exilibacterium tricleocarpae]
MSHKYPDITLLQFAKAPLLGRVKTRMAPVLSESQCLALHRRLTVQVAETIHRAGLCPQELWVGSQPQHAFFTELALRLAVPVHAQEGADLGERMLAAATTVAARARAVIIIGSDCPFIDAAYLEQAITALRDGADAVVGPAHDGGYVLLGLCRPEPRLFSGIPWGTDRVWSLTRERLRELAWRFHELAPLADIDRPQDLALLETD